MSTTTAIHALTKAAGGDAPSIASAMTGFDDVDKVLPIVSSSTPAALKNGLIWFNPTSGLWQITDGSSWTIFHTQTANSITEFASTGTYVKVAGLAYVKVRLWGGGGGSGGIAGGSGSAQSAGGAPGGYCEKIILASALLSSEPVVIGVGGVGGASGNNTGGTGGSANFGTHCSVAGGLGGGGMSATTGNATAFSQSGGSATGGDVNIAGGPGHSSQVIGGVAAWGTGYGGNAPGGGGNGGPTSTVAANAVGLFPGGGAGGIEGGTSTAGAVGGAPLCVVESYYL